MTQGIWDDLEQARPVLVRAELEGLASGWAVATRFAEPNALPEARRPVDLVASHLPHVLHAAFCQTAVPEARHPSPVPA